MIEFVYVVEYDKLSVCEKQFGIIPGYTKTIDWGVKVERKSHRNVLHFENDIKVFISKLLIDDSIENIICYKSKIRVDEGILVTDLIDFNKFTSVV